MGILLVIVIFLLILMLSIKVYRKNKLLLLGLIGLMILLSGYAYLTPRIRANQKIEAYFSYLEKTFGFKDTAARYKVEPNRSKKPELCFEFTAYNKEWHFQNDFLRDDTPIEAGVQNLRRHIYTQYKAYVYKDFIYDGEKGNSFAEVEKLLEEHGYNYFWEELEYHEEEKNSYELYTESVKSNFRVNATDTVVPLSEELTFYKDKSMEGFDYAAYMDYFSYKVVLIGTIQKENEAKKDLSIEELNKVMKEAMTSEQVEIKLQEK